MKQVIATIVVLALGASLLAACRTEPEKDDPCYVGPIKQEAIPIVPSVLRPSKVDAEGFKTATPIKHVVFIMKENRTFDHLFGAFPGANGAAYGMAGNERISLRDHCFPQVMPRDIQHNYDAAMLNWNEGKMDGFGTNEYTREWAYTQAKQEDIPNYWYWAEMFTLSDNFFASVMGPSFPNHLYSLAGTAHGTRDNPKAQGRVVVTADLPTEKSWGCDAPKGTTVTVHEDDGKSKEVFPCFKIPVLPDRLKEKGIPWAYYGASQNQEGYFWVSPDYIDHIRNVPRVWETHVYGVDQIVPDIEDGHLPPVTWVTPQFWQSDHLGASMCLGENWTTQIVNAIMRSDMWKDTVIFISWDDWGGVYDHVPPPIDEATGNPMGFRVPLMTISPYAKSGSIDKKQGDFTSVLRFIEMNWGLRPLKMDNGTVNDLTQNFDFEREPLPPAPRPMRKDCQGYEESTTNEFDPN